jgi:hypothetical protein
LDDAGWTTHLIEFASLEGRTSVTESEWIMAEIKEAGCSRAKATWLPFAPTAGQQPTRTPFAPTAPRKPVTMPTPKPPAAPVAASSNLAADRMPNLAVVRAYG